MLHDSAERGPVDRERQKDEINTQCRFNSRPKSEPRQVCRINWQERHLDYYMCDGVGVSFVTYYYICYLPEP